VTGGLPYAGGPGNNYAMHSAATMVQKLRDAPGAYGLVTANGWYLTKQSTGIYSTTPPSKPFEREDPAVVQRQIDALPHPEVVERPEGRGVIETYTVVHKREGPFLGVIVGRDANGRRFAATRRMTRRPLPASKRASRSGAPVRSPRPGSSTSSPRTDSHMARLYLIRHGRPSATWGGHDDDRAWTRRRPARPVAARDWLLSRPEGAAAEPGGELAAAPLPRDRSADGRALGVAMRSTRGSARFRRPRRCRRPSGGRGCARRSAGPGRRSRATSTTTSGAGEIAASLLARGNTAVFSHYVAINAVVSTLLGDRPGAGLSAPTTARSPVLEDRRDEPHADRKGRRGATAVL
jgi:hypothetical protein